MKTSGLLVWYTLAYIAGNQGAALNFLEPLLSPNFNFSAFKAADHEIKGFQKCPRTIEIAWRKSPPFIYKRSGGLSGSSKSVLTGIMYDILRRAFYICCPQQTQPRVAFQETERQEQDLNRLLLDEKSQIIIAPVTSIDGRTYGGVYEFIRIINSPGIVLIMSKEEFRMKARDAVWLSLARSWPIVAMTFILAAIAGIIIWALDTISNPEHFPRSFFKGILEGFWWSFVTMSTVGYGDRVRKSLCGKLFGVLWIMIGLAVCSILTATLTSALTSISTDANINILGQNIGVMEHNDGAFSEGVQQGAVIHEFKSKKAMYESLSTTAGKDGVLDEMHSGAFYVAKYKTHKLGIAKIFPREIPLGVALRHGVLENTTGDCLRKLFWLRENDILKFIEEYRKREDESTESIKSKEKDGAIINLFDGTSPEYQYLISAAAICFLLLCVFGSYVQISNCRRHINGKQQSQESSGINAETSKRVLINDSDSNYRMALLSSKANKEKEQEGEVDV